MGRVLLASLPDDELQSRLATLPCSAHRPHRHRPAHPAGTRIRQART